MILNVAKISSTSALIMMLADCKVHTSELARRYAGMLDLSSGRNLFDACISYWPHYGEVVRNRKSCVFRMVEDAVAKDGAEQVVIFGAGFDALSLEIYARHGHCRIFELDIANMEAKAGLVRSIDRNASEAIRHIGMDVTQTDLLLPSLAKHGWSPGAPSVLVFEGISYYIQEDVLWGIVGSFRTPSRTNHAVLEYLVPADCLSARVDSISRYPFDLILAESDLDAIVRYDADKIRRRAAGLGCSVTRHYTMQQMELDRTSRNLFFPAASDGWIEVCRLAI